MFIATVVPDRYMKRKYLLPVWKVANRQSRFPLHATAYYIHTSAKFFIRPCSMKNSRQSYLFSTCLQYVLHALPISPFFILIKQFLPFLSFFFTFFTFFHSVPYCQSQQKQLYQCYNAIALTTSSCMYMFLASLTHHQGTLQVVQSDLPVHWCLVCGTARNSLGWEGGKCSE